MIPKEINIVASSDPANGSINLSADGSTFDVNYSPALMIPRNAKNVTVSAESALIWWTIPNIENGVNNQFSITDDGTGSGTAYSGTISIPQGLYDLIGLAEAIEREIVNDGATQNIITFSSDSSTQKVQIKANYQGISIDFTIANSIREIIGFDSQVLGPSVGIITWLADNTASFNTVNSLLLHSNIISDGIRINNKYSQTLAQVTIDKRPGSQLVYTPYSPVKISSDNLIGSSISRLRFWMTSENPDTLVNTGGEYWSVSILIKYYEPI